MFCVEAWNKIRSSIVISDVIRYPISALLFHRQDKAEWLARLGTVRLTSAAPWQQERRIVGMLKSPVEGSTTVLLKLDRPVAAYSDFIRPVCLPSTEEPVLANSSHCTTLGWARNRKFCSTIGRFLASEKILWDFHFNPLRVIDAIWRRFFSFFFRARSAHWRHQFCCDWLENFLQKLVPRDFSSR